MNKKKGVDGRAESARRNLAAARAKPGFEGRRLAGIAAWSARVQAEKAAKNGAAQNGNGHKSLAEAIEALTPQQIVGAIQGRINELNEENALLYEQLVSVRTEKDVLSKEIYDLRKENRDMASELRTAKEERSSGLRLFARK